jgi:transcriptional regulator with XRE-family HTH domain
MEAAGLTQDALGDVAGVSRESVSRLVNARSPGPRGLKAHNVARCLIALGITPKDLAAAYGTGPRYEQIVFEMEKLAEVDFSAYIQKRLADHATPPPAIKKTPGTVVLLSPTGTTITAKADGTPFQAKKALNDLAEIVTPAGWVVSSPV